MGLVLGCCANVLGCCEEGAGRHSLNNERGREKRMISQENGEVGEIG